MPKSKQNAKRRTTLRNRDKKIADLVKKKTSQLVMENTWLKSQLRVLYAKANKDSGVKELIKDAILEEE